jgi:pimeloyl-ACP methyl ester carboxylesterase
MPGHADKRLRAHDGLELAYRLYRNGAGRPLLLLHGGGANLVSMDQWAERLGAGHTTVSLDIRGCGQSGDLDRFSWADTVRDLESLVDELALGPVDIVGHSLGGFVAGFYATDHPEARVVSIDGFGPGMPTVGDDADQAAFASFQAGMKAAFWAMTEPPDEGDRAWRDAQVEALVALFPRMGYTAPNARAMAERNLVDLGDGRYRRHPSRVVFVGGFADGGTGDVLRMYRHVRSPTLIVRCTESGAPLVLDQELDALAEANGHVEVARLPLTHLAPAWDAIDEVAALAHEFLSRPYPGGSGSPTAPS